jgi:bifunctional UDP-N-acetylglucosamine pyrophosphorylase/glucosamine-1-phosphate N-acetyltransferase
MKLNIIILAAGNGKRMFSSLPKVLHPIGGIPMLEHVVTTAQSLNPANIYVVHGDGGDEVKDTLLHLDVHWVEQRQQLGTGHAVHQVTPYLEDNGQVLILYGDAPLISQHLLQEFIKTAPQNELSLITAKVNNPDGFGRIIRDKNNNVMASIEQKDANAEQLQINEINTGILLIPAKVLKNYLPKINNNNKQKEYYLTDIIKLAANNKHKINALITSQIEEVLGINDKQQLATQERYYQKQQAQQLMQKGLTLMDPKRFDLRGELEFGQDVVIDINVLIKGKVKLGNNVKILANCILEDSIIEDNCTIGPFARTRPGTHIQANAEIGNFVELKNTNFGKNSKANHLSYLGDATIGKDVNIGAGTITCNYDGVHKHPTTIEDNAFIGSDTMLVAPVKVGKNATIGAGSTITKKVPENQLTVARSKQRSIKGWQRPKRKK